MLRVRSLVIREYVVKSQANSLPAHCFLVFAIRLDQRSFKQYAQWPHTLQKKRSVRVRRVRVFKNITASIQLHSRGNWPFCGVRYDARLCIDTLPEPGPYAKTETLFFLLLTLIEASYFVSPTKWGPFFYGPSDGTHNVRCGTPSRAGGFGRAPWTPWIRAWPSQLKLSISRIRSIRILPSPQ